MSNQQEEPNYNYPSLEESEQFLYQKQKQNIYYKNNEIKSRDERIKIRKGDLATDFGIINGILSLLMLFEVAIILKLYFQPKKQLHFIDLDGAIFMFGITYAFYLIESIFIADTKDYIQNVLNYEQTTEYLQTLKQTIPEITYHVEGYHYENRPNRNQRRHGNGGSSNRKVVTYRDQHQLNIHTVEDISDDIQASFEFCNLFRIQIIQVVEPASQSDFIKIKDVKNKLINKAKSREQHVDFRQEVKIKGLKQHVVFCLNPQYKPDILNLKMFYLWTFLGCNMVYRNSFHKDTGFIQYLSKKKISVNNN